MAQKPRKGDFGDLKSKTFPWGAGSRTPDLKACALSVLV